MTRLDEYRDLLERWACWWNERESINHDPAPFHETVTALACGTCADWDLGNRRCVECGRTGKP